MSLGDLFNRIEQNRRDGAKNSGWASLDVHGQDAVWAKFYNEFNFKPSINPSEWPSFKEPPPSITFAIGHFWKKNDDRQQKLKSNIADLYRLAFSSLQGTCEKIYALNWHHTCYSFNPDTDFTHIEYSEWLVPPIPNGDYYIFVSSDMTQGFLGHPWEQTICAFGNRILATVEANPIPLFDDPIRVDGRPN